MHADDTATAELFGAETGDEVDTFARCSWSAGVPVLDGAAAWFAARVLERVDVGDHVVQVVAPGEGEAGRDGHALSSIRPGRRLAPGHLA